MKHSGASFGHDVQASTIRSTIDGLTLEEAQDTIGGFVLEQTHHALNVASNRRLVEWSVTTVVLAVNLYTCVTQSRLTECYSKQMFRSCNCCLDR